MTLADLEDALRRALPVHTVDGLEKFPFKTYAEFLNAVERGHVELLTAFDPAACAALGTRSDKTIQTALTWSPFLVAAACVVGAFALRFWLLLGVPLAFMGMFLSIPGFMRSMGIWLNRVLVVAVIYLWFQSAIVTSLIVLSYLVPNTLCHMARHHCRIVLLRAVAQSELVLVWLFQKGSLVPNVRSAQQV